MIKQGEVAFIKTTGEAAYVLALSTNETGQIQASVRRPTSGQDGIFHHTDMFLADELETLDEQQRRFINERKAVMEKFGPKDETMGESASAPDLGLSIN